MAYRNTPLQAQYVLIGGILLSAGEEQRIIKQADGTVITADPRTLLWFTQRQIDRAVRNVELRTKQVMSRLVIPYTQEIANEIKTDRYGGYRTTEEMLVKFAPVTVKDPEAYAARVMGEILAEYGLVAATQAA